MHGAVAEAQDAVSVVKGAVTGHDAQLNMAKSVIEQNQAQIAELSQAQLTHSDIVAVKNMNQVHNALVKVQGAVSAVQGVVTEHDQQLGKAREAIEQNQADIEQLNQKVQANHGQIVNVQGVVSNVHGEISEVQDAVSAVRGAVTEHGRKMSVAQTVIEEGQVQAAKLESRILATHNDLMKVHGSVSEVQSAVNDVQGAINGLQGDVSGQARALA